MGVVEELGHGYLILYTRHMVDLSFSETSVHQDGRKLRRKMVNECSPKGTDILPSGTWVVDLTFTPN